jgi:glycosyltransferase involved in cell wall biosynthesis
LKVIHLSSSDYNGGAAIAAKRIVIAQRLLPELDSKLLVQIKRNKDNFIISSNSSTANKILSSIRQVADELSIRLLSVQSRGRFTFPFWGEDVSNDVNLKEADIINLHWINGGFLSLKSLVKLAALNKPVVWTLHDMWAFTGGCHYASECNRFFDHCSNCPSLLLKSERDFSYKIYDSKLELYRQLNLTFITCSNWLAEEASKSSLLKNKKVFVIPNPLRTEIFKPINQKIARERLELPIDKKIILIGAMNLKDERKGFWLLIEALNIFKSIKLHVDIELVVFGKLNDESLQKIPIKIHQLGKLKSEDEIIYAYNSADVYLAPSLQDNLPNTVMEAMACGTPVVAFNVGGIPDMVDDGINGFLATLKSSEELAKSIELILSDEELSKRFSLAAREKVIKNFDEKLISEKYFEVYKSLV